MATKNFCSECGEAAQQGTDEMGGEGALHCPAHPVAVIESVVVTTTKTWTTISDLRTEVDALLGSEGTAALVDTATAAVRAMCDADGKGLRLDAATWESLDLWTLALSGALGAWARETVAERRRMGAGTATDADGGGLAEVGGPLSAEDVAHLHANVPGADEREAARLVAEFAET